MTEYIVFSRRETVSTAEETGTSFSNGWRQAAKIEARSAESAIRKYVENPPEGAVFEAGTFAAVPARSWKPVAVKVETKTALKFS